MFCFSMEWLRGKILPRVELTKSKTGKDGAGQLPEGNSVTNEGAGECNPKAEHGWKRSNNLNSSVWKIITY